MRIDAHQHFWKLERGDYGWLTQGLGVLYRNYLPGDLTGCLIQTQMDKTILIQAAPTVRETEYLLDLYETHEFIAGVVGWLDLKSPQFLSDYKRLRNHRGFVGVRPMLQDLSDDRWVLRSTVLKNIEMLAADDFPLDLLIHPRHLPVIKELLKIFPNLRAVVNHLGKPRIADQVIEPWKEQLSEIAHYKNVMCKLSGIVTEAGSEIEASAIEPYVHHVVQAFGPRAVMFGSDWPVCLLKTSYQNVVELLERTLPSSLSESDKSAIYGENSKCFYKLKL